MGRYGLVSVFFACCFVLFFRLSEARGFILEAENAELGGDAEVVLRDGFGGAARRADLAPSDPQTRLSESPDVTFYFDVPESDRYEIRVFTGGPGLPSSDGRVSSEEGSHLNGWFSVGENPPKERILVEHCGDTAPHKERIEKLFLPAGKTPIRFWLSDGCVLDRIRIDPYFPENVPDSAQGYRPSIVPPPAHPRLWVTPAFLPTVKERMNREPNASMWKKVYERSLKPFGTDSANRESLEEAAGDKAFVYLVTGNETVGREAVALIKERLLTADFVNIHDVTREIGRLIYDAALVYDWCYPLMTSDDCQYFHDRAFELAEEMEIGWPPFAQPITCTHGNEMQLNRDLLSMAIACYELDPMPYEYCAYRVLEELVPMRNFQFQSPRHDQGTSYASHRYDCEMSSALLFQRMSGIDIHGPGSKAIRDYYLFLRLPGGGMLRDGDGTGDGPFFQKHRSAMMFLAAYSGDPLVKGEWERLGGVTDDTGEDILFLLFNDPDAPSDPTCNTLPLAWDSGPILCSQILRTGWDLSPDSNDVIVEFKGGCYRFGNHQHADAGSFQIFRHGYLNADLGQYHNYGDLYDYGFAKRSVSHSVLLVHDPEESFEGSTINDGGQRFFERSPWTAEEAQNDPEFRTGHLVDSRILPDCANPSESFFSVNLAEAYSDKVRDYLRTLVWLKTDDPDVPVAVIVCDRVKISNPNFRVDWQINTLSEPVTVDEQTFSVTSVPPPRGDGNPDSVSKRSGMTVTTLLPKSGAYERTSLGGRESALVDGVCLKPPKERPEAFGWRTCISPNTKSDSHVFLHVLQIGNEDISPKPISFEEREGSFIVEVAGRHVEIDTDGQCSFDSEKR